MLWLLHLFVLAYDRAHTLRSFEQWLQQSEYAPTDIFESDVSLFYRPTGFWFDPQVIHEYLTLFQQSDITRSTIAGGKISLIETPTSFVIDDLHKFIDVNTILDDTWFLRVPITLTVVDTGEVLYESAGVLKIQFRPGSHRIHQIEAVTPNVDDETMSNEIVVAWANVVESKGVEFWCTRMADWCGAAHFPYTNSSECIADWSLRPWVTLNPNCTDQGRLLSGDANVCRVLHIESGKARPDIHCPHAGPNSIYCNDCMCGNDATKEFCSSLN